MKLRGVSSSHAVSIGLVAIVYFVRESPAATINNWNIAGGGSWNTSTNWNPANVPTATEAATFTAGLPAATNVITLDGNQTAYA